MRKFTKGLSFAAASVAVVISLIGGCSGKTTSSSPGTSSSGSPASQSIGSAGGTVTSSDGKASVAIPAGALSADVMITITALGIVMAPDVAKVGGAYQLGPAGTTFAKPVTVTMPYDATTIPPPDTSSTVQVFTADDGSSTFASLPTTLVDASHVSAQSTHFSTYVAGVPAKLSGGGDAGGVVPPPCDNVALFCEYSQNIDGGIGCDCHLTCNGIAYLMQCVCGSCGCYQDSTSTKTFSLPVSACDLGGSGLGGSWFNTCNFPGSKNMGGGGGSTSVASGATCQ
jgi:hypothetical protein